MTYFISFEGCDGSGKSTQARFLGDYLQKHRPESQIWLTKEIGGSDLADKLRKLLLAEEITDPLTELFLISAARRDHSAVIREKMKQNSGYFAVISDRYSTSSLAYQAYAKGLDLAITQQIIEWSTSNLRPDLTFILDLPPDLAKARIQNSDSHGNFYDCKDLDFYNRVRHGFLSIAQQNPQNFVIIDASQTRELVSQAILQACVNKGMLTQS